MAATVGSINVLFNVQYGQAIAGTRALAGEVHRGGERMQRSVRATDRSVLSLQRSMAGMRGREFRILALSALRAQSGVERLRQTLLATSALFGGFGAAFTLRGIQEYSDTYKTVANRLRIVKGEAQDLADMEREIFHIAQRSRAQYEATGVLFARMANASKRLGIAQRDVLRVTETIQKSFLVGGSTPVEAAQSAIQLSQGIASDRLQGDELRSVLENPALGQLLADRITDGNLGQLRELAADGELTAGVIIRAFKDASEEIDALFAQTEQTIGQAFIKVDNALMRYIGTNEKVNATSRATVTLLNALAENMDTVVDSLALLAGAFAAVFGARATAGIVATIASTRALRIEARNTAAAQLALAQAQDRVAASRVASARAAYEMSKASTVSLATQRRMGRGLQSAMQERLRTQTALTAATATHSQTLRAATVRGMAFAGAGRAASAAWAFIGGPIGAALLALGAGMYVLSRQAAAAEERSARYAEAIKEAGENSENAEAGIRSAAEGLEWVAEAATNAERATRLMTAQSDLAGFFREMNAAVQRLGASSDGWSTINIQQDLQVLKRRLFDGEISLNDFIEKVDEISKTNPDASDIIAEIQAIARNAIAAMAAVDALKSSVESIGDPVTTEKGDRPGAMNRAQERFDEIMKTYTRMHPDIFDKLRGGSKGGMSDAAKAAERFVEKLEELRQEALTFDLDKIDQEVVAAARSIGFADEKIRAFIDAMKAGGQGPEDLMRLKAAMQEIADLEFTRNLEGLRERGVTMMFSELDQEVIKTARSFEVAESKVKAFIAALLSGDMSAIPPEIAKIREELEKIERNERIKDMAEELGGAFGEFARSAVSGFDNMSDAVQQLANRLIDLAIQLMVIEPLIRMLKEGMGGGTGFLGFLGKLLVPVQHGGGDAGKSRVHRAVPVGAVSGAKRYHTGKAGMKHDEVMAILEETESVVTGRSMGRIGSALESANAMMRDGQPGAQINIIDQAGTEKRTQRRKSGSGREIIDVVIERVKGEFTSGGFDEPMRARFGAGPKVIPR